MVKSKRVILSDGLLSKKEMPLLAGTDEAGRGCLAGPVAAAAVLVPDGFDIIGLEDSKVLTAQQREQLAGEIRNLVISWGIGLAWMKEIEKINILQASLMAMSRAAASLLHKQKERKLPGILYIDGTQIIPPLYFSRCHIEVPEQKSIVDGDALIPSISAASVLAKTFRDRLMVNMDSRWPQYGFAKHKGYGTKEHLDALKKYGPCPLHRMDFRGVCPEKKREQGRLL